MTRSAQPAPGDRAAASSQAKVIVPHQPKWHQRLLAAAAFGLERGLTSSLRVRWIDDSHVFTTEPPQTVIFCLWHNRLALSMLIFRRWVKRHQPSRRLAALISASKDGALLAAMLEKFGVQPVRGSSSRRGGQALLELKSWAERGYDVAITPDGPRGPRYRVQPGVIALAQVTGLPILPVTYKARRKIAMKSWDRFQIPLPLTACEIRIQKPICVPAGATDAEREEVRAQLERCLLENTVD